MDHDVYNLGAVRLQDGITLPSVNIVYKTYGTLNAAKDNAILFPTWYSGQHPDVAWVIGSQWALDPARYFIVVANIFGNGMSASPSNQPPPFDRSRFPRFTILDNVLLQRRLLTERFGIDVLRAVIGRSMGAQLAFQWGAAFPDKVERILPLVGSARTSPHNFVFLQNVRMAITSDPAWQNGEYTDQPALGLARMRLIFDSWGLSQTWYRQGLYRDQGHETAEDFLNRKIVAPPRDANDLLAQVRTWERADISDNETYKKDFPAALRAIKARAIVMPVRTDLYFPPEDSEIEVSHMPNAELRVLESVWGHRGAAPGTDPRGIAFFDTAIRDLLAR
jgi:homoserine O-acetyltransferase/O-succinyltransferase